ncbi:35218_t:CDS:2 [Gigaspora margarita]|uniref:35218_t:CDS:1 n=1 Tax=Gigaspora margarita TaxID=4874 RepID=A0ABM8VZV2_GIGMA|nr:35218_t:CDS:2 [Gigaspora margarita]
MGRISNKIKEGAKVSILGSVIGEDPAHLLLETFLRVAPGNNRWVINLDLQPKKEIVISAGCIKFVSANADEIDVSNSNNMLWTDEIVTIDTRQVSRSYNSTPAIHISNIANATPRLFFERFMPINFIMSTVIPSTNKVACECEQAWTDLTWMEFMQFIGILTIMTYVKCADICDYWSIKSDTPGVSLSFGQYMLYKQFRNIIKYLTLMDTLPNDDPFHFARQFHDEFNKNLAKATQPGHYLCIDKSMYQWMGKVDKALADAQTNLFLQLDSAEPPEYSLKKSSQTNTQQLFTDTCISLYNHGLYSILQIKKCRYWPKNIPHDITNALDEPYGSFITDYQEGLYLDSTAHYLKDMYLDPIAHYLEDLYLDQIAHYLKDMYLESTASY